MQRAAGSGSDFMDGTLSFTLCVSPVEIFTTIEEKKPPQQHLTGCFVLQATTTDLTTLT